MSERERLGELARGERERLGELARRLAGRPELWEPHVRHDPEERVFHELDCGDGAGAWLICWMPGHDTGFHDHDGASGFVVVLRGVVREERLCVGGPPISAIYGAGDTFDFGPHDIHRVRHAGTGPTVTLHVYSPRLRGMGAYAISPDGRLARHRLPEGAALAPLP
ncbi:MAG TPA: cysteine dioxygenase family protein [Solirubrobacteraceae bacterium]